MPPFLPVGLAAGLATALLFASASAGGMTGRFILFFLAPLPSYLAGLGWGVVAATVAAASSALVTALLLGAKTGAVFFLSQGIPLILLCRLVLMNRIVPASGPDAATAAPIVEWYPIGRVLALAAALAGALSVASMLLLGADLDELRTMMRKLVDEIITRELPGLGSGELSEGDKDTLATVLLHALPAGSAVLWLGGFALNLYLAGKVTLYSGRLARPWPDLGLVHFPSGFGWAFAAMLGLSLVPGIAGIMASGIAGAIFFAYTLTGLAIVHYLTRGMAVRPMILWGIYVVLIVLNTSALIVIALIAILEPMLWYRRPRTPEFGPVPPAAAPPARPPD